MLKLLPTFIFIVYSQVSISQFEKWSQLDTADKNEVLEISKTIIESLNENNFAKCASYLDPNELCLNGGLWSPTETFIDMFNSLIKDKEFFDSTKSSYIFDDFQNKVELQSIPRNVFRVFDNSDIIVTGKYHVPKDKAEYDFYLIFENNNDKWIVSTVYLSDVKLIDKTSASEYNNHRKEILDSLGLTLMVPKNFSKLIMLDSFPSFILPGVSQRDAIIQIITTDLKAPYDFMTKKYVELVVLKNFSNPYYTISYLPNGIKFDYSLVNSEDGINNKGITIGLEKNGKLILIQFYSYETTYNEIWKEIDLMLRNIQI